MELLKILIPVVYGMMPIYFAFRTLIPERKKRNAFIATQGTYRFVKGTVLSVTKKSNVTNNSKAINMYTIEYSFIAEDGNEYKEIYRHFSKKEFTSKEVNVHYDPQDPKKHFLELEVAHCERKIKDSYRILYSGLLTALFLVIFMNIAL